MNDSILFAMASLVFFSFSIQAFEWITSLEESDQFHSGLPLYNLVLRECINRGSMIDVGRCLELMDNRLMGRSEITYWELLKVCTKLHIL